MLLKNDKKVDISKFDDVSRKDLKAIIGRKQVITFQLVDQLSRPGPRGTRTYKRRHLIEAYHQNRDKTGNTSEYRYYKTSRPGKVAGEIKYTPEMVMFEGGGKININIGDNQKDNLDLLYFLYTHPRRASGPNSKNVDRPLFYLVDENAQALQYAQKREAASEMENLLWNKENRLGDEELITIAQALRISDVDDMIIARIQVEIQKVCKKDPQRFLTLAKLDKETEMRANIQLALEAGVLNFDNKNMKWLIIDGDNRGTLTPIRQSDDKVTALVHFLKNQDDNDHYGRITELLKDSKLQEVKG